MRERTPSADDTPKRAPPALPREAASADVAGSKTSSEAADVFGAAKFTPATTASSTATGASSPSRVDVRMVASSHNLDDLGVNHPASANSDPRSQQQQEKHGHAYRSAQTAQDKRSRLSNVINNLRKKVPDTRDSPRKEEDDRNSVERNLETLEKYVMTVLNGVIKDEEDDDDDREALSKKKEAASEKSNEAEKLPEDQEDEEDSKGPAAKFEPSRPNESRTEAAVVPSEQPDKPEAKEFPSERQKKVDKTESSLKKEEFNRQENINEVVVSEEKKPKADEEEDVCRIDRRSSKEAKSEEQSVLSETARSDEDERKENRSLGTIIMERLSESQFDDKSNVDPVREDCREQSVSDNAELRNVCRDLLNDLLNDINQLIDENSQEKEQTRSSENSMDSNSRDSRTQEFSMTSLHCSLPLDKVASVLQNCQTAELAVPQSPLSSSSSSSSQGSKSPCKPPSPTVRHLCLYCDRKFMSISLRQRHTERVHQHGGGRRSERNSRKPSQNCQYCSDKCAESLEGLFQHMVGSHGDKYHGCLQCSTRYLTREALAVHMSENHGVSVERNLQIQEKMKESSPCKEQGNQNSRDVPNPKERRSEDTDHERTEPTNILLKPVHPAKDNFSNPGSPEFDSSFYSSVSCNIRENLLHHLDGKLQSCSSSSSCSSTVTSSTGCSSAIDVKPQQQQPQQSFYEHNVSQIQFPIDISLTAATPVYSKEYGNEEYENNSEYAQKPGKSNRSHPRRVSFEKYNFPRKYDGKEQWTCSIKDLSKFDISTQLSLRKKQQLLKEHLSLSRLQQITVLAAASEMVQNEQSLNSRDLEETAVDVDKPLDVEQVFVASEAKRDVPEANVKQLQETEFTVEFGNFLRLRKWNETTTSEAAKKQETVYAELTGEWSRPRVYVCGTCASKHVTLKEMEDHKVTTHPNVWCSHFEFSGDQRELYKHLFLPGKDVPTAKARAAILVEKVCTKCSKNCTTLPELHRHMLECGGDQAWLLGLFGNGKKKCKWRPFGSRSRRRRQRGMKRNIQNSQTPRVNAPREKQPTGPRVRPSDRESIQKMLANLPPKRATRKVLQDTTLRTQGRLRTVQTRTRPRLVGENSSVSRMSRNKAALRNKLLKNAKSIQRNRCRIDNISAVIESVVRNYASDLSKPTLGEGVETREASTARTTDPERETKEKTVDGCSAGVGGDGAPEERGNRAKTTRGPRVLGKKRNVRTKDGTVRSLDQAKRTSLKAKTARTVSKILSEAKTETFGDGVRTSKTGKACPRSLSEKEAETEGTEASPGEARSPSLKSSSKSSTQSGTPKRKRPVDPVASLNASIKAKSQLRTQDGKFARNPNKESVSPQKSPEAVGLRCPVSGQVLTTATKERGGETSPESSITRSKLRAVSKCKNGDQSLPKRTTRLSSDSDKMPTLEPAVRASSPADEYPETSANDLPILSPVTPASAQEKNLRGGKALMIGKCLNDKENAKKQETQEPEKRTGSSLKEEEKEQQKQGKGRRAKNDAKSLNKTADNLDAKTDASKEVIKGLVKEKFKRRSAPAKISNAEEKKTTGTVARNTEETSLKKEVKQKKEETVRSNVKTKLESVLDDDDDDDDDDNHNDDDDSPIKIQNVPFEVKKLIGSDNKEDLLTKLVLTTRIATSKRCLRQPASKFKLEQSRSKSRKDPEVERALKLDSGSTSDASTKKEKLDARRKSLRKTDRKDTKNERTVAEEANRTKDSANEVKSAARGRRSSSLTNESKSLIGSSQSLSPFDVQTKSDTSASTSNTQNADKRQTRGSTLNSGEGNVAQSEDSSLKKNPVGKRRGRVKSNNNDVSERRNTQEACQTKNEETEVANDVDSTEAERNEAKLAKEENERKMASTEREHSKGSDRPLENRERDSGKENSVARPAPVQKLKVGRPRKSWGARKEQASKKSLNNVIGILTEGINVPVDAQPSILSTQTGTDNAESGVSPQIATPQADDDASKIPPSLDKSVESSENTVSEVLATVPDKSVTDSPRVRRISNEKDPKQTEAAKDPNLEKPTEKIRKGESSLNENEEQSPANDIILDLSRRKQKGKGSFLERIVSKIAKQKDALLEGEVGSLLDTAADELTSILNEVGPAFSENAETSTDTRTATKAEKIRDTAQGSEKIEKSADKSCPSRDSSVQNEEKEEKISMELATEFASRVENSNDEEAKDESKVTCKSGEIADQETETKLPMEEQEETSFEGDEKENCIDGSKEQDGFIPAETSSATSNNNKVLSPAIENTLEVPASNVADSPSSRLKREKEKHEEVAGEGRVKKRSKKRSLEGKSKKKTTESTDNSEESVVSDELHPLADSTESIEKSKQVPSAEENVPDTGDKTQQEESGTKDVDAAENSSEIITELAVDPANDTEERTRKNKDQGAEQFEEVVDATKIKEEIDATSEEKNSSRKRRYCVGEVDRYSEVQASPIRRSSYKRRSHPPEEEKVSQIFEEETVSAEMRETCTSEEVTLENARGSRRRSFRTKLTVRKKEEKSEGKLANENENNSAVGVSATGITENTELWKNMEESIEKGETVLDETPKQQTTLSDSLEEQSKEKEESSSAKNSEETNKEQIGQTVSVELEKTTEEAPVVAVKVPKKRGRKKKCLTIDQTQSTQPTVSRENPKHESIVTSHQLPPRRSLRTNKLAEETESQRKNFNHLANLQVPSSNEEPFKVPEVTELLLQHTKKRTYKRRSTTDENLDVQSNCPRAEPEAGGAECLEERKSSTEKEDQSENLCQKDPLEEKKHTPVSEHVDLERSSSVGSLDLTDKTEQIGKTRTSKKKQVSSEDLSEQGRLNQRQHVESADNLSETSCVSDFSYLRKKRYSKKRKELRASRREDASATDSESVDVERSTDRRQILKRRAKKNIFFAEFYLMDDFDIPMDISDCVSSREDVTNAKNDVDQEPEPKLKPPDEEEKLVEGAVSPKEMLVEKPTGEDKIEKRDEDSKKSVEDDDDEEEQEEEGEDDDEDDEDEDELKNEDQMDEKLDGLSQTQDDFQSPKKRAAGNYVVVHKKTGEILIVEKRKKLTKEAARFFCDVCTTSFTRKSSLKKHSQSQSHLLQMVKSKKNAASTTEDVENAEDSFAASQNDVSSDENRVESADEATNILSESRDDQENGDDASKSAVPEPLRSDLCYSSHLEQNSLMNSPATHQHMLEDELLDEEICKITENMNHDEYVITDQVSSEPESISTPVKMEVKAVEDAGKRKKHEKKKEKAKKKSLIDEQILLDSPELGENPTDDDTLVSVLGANMSIKIAKSSCLNASEANVARRDASESSFEGSRTDILRTRENDFQEPCLDGAAKLQENRDTDVDIEIDDALLRTEVSKIAQDNSIYKVNPEERNDDFSSVRLDDTGTEKRNQPYERLSLKLTINARGIEVCKDTDLDKCDYSSTFVKKSEDVTRNCEKSHESARVEPIENCSYVESRTEGSDEDSSSSTPCESQRRGRKSLENSIDELDVASKVQRVTETPENAKDQQTESEKQNESGKTPPCHGRSRRVRAKRQSEETEINSEGKAAKSLAPRPKVEQNESTTKFSESMEASAIDGFNTTLGEKLERLEESSIKNDSVLVLESLESQNVCESNESEELESKRLEENPESTKETTTKQSMEQRVPEEETVRSEDRIKFLESIDDDEASSSSSLADKPLSQILLEREQKLDAYKEIIPCSMDAPEDSANESKPESKSKVENERTVDDDYSRANEPIENEKPGDKDSNVDDEQTKIASEEEASKTTEDNSDKDSKISSESENSEAVPPMKNVSKEKEPESEIISNVGRKSSASKRATKSHRYSSAKDSHRRARGRKSSIRSKLADLSSESDDSENEGETESQNKSKIVKSVFGRVFGGEKADKVKEVLNDWVSKSEDDSDISRTCFKYSGTNEARAKDCTNEKNSKRHSVSSSSPRKRSGKQSKKNPSSDRAKEKKVYQENQVDEHHSGRHVRSKSSNSKKKHDTETSNSYFLHLPATKCRLSKKRAEELISRTFEDDFTETNVDKSQKSRHKEPNYGLRNQGKPDLTIKDSGYGSFHYDEDSSKMAPMEDTADDEQQKVIKRRKLSDTKRGRGKSEEESWQDLVEAEKKASKNPKESDDEEDSLMKDVHRKRSQLINRLSVDLEESSRTSCSSLAPSSVRNRSPSMDRNSQTTRDSDVDDDEEDEDAGHGRISPLFVCGTPRSSVETSSNSENEEEDENLVANDAVTRKSSSEFSGEKIVIRSPCSSHKSEVVTIAPTDAIEDNALDVPQEIETAKPRQGKVLNFDEELFVECCSRLKATTENELRGAKKIKLDHNEGYHRKDEQQQGFRGPRDRWKDVESQNSLGSLLESVNQLLGEEMYSTRERDYAKRGGRNLRSEHSSRSASPDTSRADNLGYEDSLDVAFEHNNKLRDKIQQRMRESENLIASTFSQKSNNDIVRGQRTTRNNELDILTNSYSRLQDQKHLPGPNLSNGGYNEPLHVKGLQDEHGAKVNLDSSGLKGKMNSSLGGLLDKALSNLLHSNEKHDHNGSTPMKVLAELACARAPTTTSEDTALQESAQFAKTTLTKDATPNPSLVPVSKDLQKKSRNPIKELFERKKEMNERKQQEKSKNATEAALKELNVHRQRKTKKTKKHQDFPLIRRNEHGGLMERKKRRDGFERKEEFASNRIKDVYEFDEEESQIEPNLGSVMSYRSRPGYEVSCLRTKEVDVAGLMSKAIGDTLENGKTADALSTRLESMIDRKFKELEKFAPKTKGALKAFQSEDQQRQITGPMDEFVERKQPTKASKKLAEQTTSAPTTKHPKLKKRSKNSKKKARNSWYENDSSDEYRTAVKTEDVGVGISKSQRTCSKGKQNIFAELYTSSESEFEDEDADYESKRQRRVKKNSKKEETELENVEQNQELVVKYTSDNEDQADDWKGQDSKNDVSKHDCDNKKSESEMSDHPLVIDERKDVDEQRNSDDETENQYERNFEMDDLYREDSSIVDSDVEDVVPTVEPAKVPEEVRIQSPSLSEEKTDAEKADYEKADYMQGSELIPLEEALDLLDQADNENSLGAKYGDVARPAKPDDCRINPVVTVEPENETFNSVDDADLLDKVATASPTPVEEQEEEPDDDLPALPEKLSSNEKPQKESENLPLHVFLSRKVQESKKRKEQQLKKMQEEQERILMNFQPTRRQRKCAIGKQGLLAEISSSDEEISPRDRKVNDRSDHDKPRKQKRESKEKRKERYIEKKHEQMIAKEQKAIEEEILREVGKKKESLAQNNTDAKNIIADVNSTKKPTEDTESAENKVPQEPAQKKKHQAKEKQKRQAKTDEEDSYAKNNHEGLSDLENNCNKPPLTETNREIAENNQESPTKQKKHFKSPMKPRKTPKSDQKVIPVRKSKNSNVDRKAKTDSKGTKDKERRSSSGKRDSDDEELKTTKSWNKVEEGVGVAIGRRKRAAANQLYYWSSSSDEEEMLEMVPAVEEEEDDRQEQHGWIVGDSHKRMITMLAMEKQLKEKRRRSEDEFEPGRTKSKKHRNSTS